MRAYELPGGLQGLTQPSTADRIIGSLEGDRATKTFFTTERGAMLVSLLLTHARGVVKTTMRLHQKFYGAGITLDECIEQYPGCKKWMELHQNLVQHFASFEGFSVQAVVRLAQSQLLDANRQPESSILEVKKDAPK